MEESAVKGYSTPSGPLEPKRRCTITVTEVGWHGSRTAAAAVGCHSISELIEKLGRGELSLVHGDTVDPYDQDSPNQQYHEDRQPGNHRSGLPIEGTKASPSSFVIALQEQLLQPIRRFSSLVITGACAALILVPLLYVVELTLPDGEDEPEALIIPETGDQVAGYTVTDHFRIRPVHPVTGAKNVPHNGVDLDTPSGTPVYAVGRVGDQVNVKCWWDVDGGGWVADQTASSFPDHVFQSLHLLEEECRAGQFEAGDVIALTGNSGLGTGEHYDFRVKLEGRYVPPEQRFLESALTGIPLPNVKRFLF